MSLSLPPFTHLPKYCQHDLASSPDLFKYYQETLRQYIKLGGTGIAEVVSKVITKDIVHLGLSFSEIELKLPAPQLARLLVAVEQGNFGVFRQRDAIHEMVKHGSSVTSVLNRLNARPDIGVAELNSICGQIIDREKNAVSDVRSGRAQAIDYLVGEIRKSLMELNAQASGARIKRRVTEVLAAGDDALPNVN